MFTHADGFTCFCHCAFQTLSFYYSASAVCKTLWLFTHQKLQYWDQSWPKPSWLTQLKTFNIKHSRREKTWTRNTLGFVTPTHGSLYAPWVSKNGFPSRFPSQRWCICARMGSAVSFHCWDTNHKSAGLPDLVKSHIEAALLQLVSLPGMYCEWMAERKMPLRGLCLPEISFWGIKPETVVEMVVLEKICVCNHTNNLFNLVQISSVWFCIVPFN